MTFVPWRRSSPSLVLLGQRAHREPVAALRGVPTSPSFAFGKCGGSIRYLPEDLCA